MAEKGHAEILRMLIGCGADIHAVDSNGATPLYWAAGNGHFDVVRCLVAGGADMNVVDRNGAPPLFYAASDEIKRLFEV